MSDHQDYKPNIDRYSGFQFHHRMKVLKFESQFSPHFIIWLISVKMNYFFFEKKKKIGSHLTQPLNIPIPTLITLLNPTGR